jgi:hypothetical protein
MAVLPQGPVAKVGGRSISYEDLVLVAVSDGSWEEFVCWCVEGLRRDEEGAVSAGDVRRAAEAFRRHRKLEAGEDLRAWLAERAITMAQWQSHLRRRVVQGEDTVTSYRSTGFPAEFEDALRIYSFCRQFWEGEVPRVLTWSVAAELVGEVAPDTTELDRFVELAVNDDVARLGAIGGDWLRERMATLMAWCQAYERLGAHLADESTIAGFVAERWVDWSVITVESCLVPTESAAREALLCATEDDLKPEEISERAKGTVELSTVGAGEFDSGLPPRLLSAPIDTPAGPIRHEDRWSVVWVRDRRPPDPTDPVVRADVTAELVVDAVQRQLIDRESWCAPV